MILHELKWNKPNKIDFFESSLLKYIFSCAKNTSFGLLPFHRIANKIVAKNMRYSLLSLFIIIIVLFFPFQKSKAPFPLFYNDMNIAAELSFFQ